jgi:hypothetical protein
MLFLVTSESPLGPVINENSSYPHLETTASRICWPELLRTERRHTVISTHDLRLGESRFKFRFFFSVHPSKCWENILNLAITASFHIHSDPLFTWHNTIPLKRETWIAVKSEPTNQIKRRMSGLKACVHMPEKLIRQNFARLKIRLNYMVMSVFIWPASSTACTPQCKCIYILYIFSCLN